VRGVFFFGEVFRAPPVLLVPVFFAPRDFLARVVFRAAADLPRAERAVFFDLRDAALRCDAVRFLAARFFGLMLLSSHEIAERDWRLQTVADCPDRDRPLVSQLSMGHSPIDTSLHSPNLKSALDRYAIPNSNFDLVATSRSGPRRAERAKQYSQPAKGEAVKTGILRTSP
jgi:hypothetical protein